MSLRSLSGIFSSPASVRKDPAVQGVVSIKVIEAKFKSGGVGNADPYCCVEFQKQKKKTGTIKHSQNPRWNFQINFNYLEDNDMVLHLSVWEKDIFKDSCIGTTDIDLNTLELGMAQDLWFILEKKSKSKDNKKKQTGEIHLSVLYTLPSTSARMKKSGDDWVVINNGAENGNNHQNGNGDGLHNQNLYGAYVHHQNGSGRNSPSPVPNGSASPHKDSGGPPPSFFSPGPVHNGGGSGLNSPAPGRPASGLLPRKKTKEEMERDEIERLLKEEEENDRKQRQEEEERLFQEFLANEYRCSICSESTTPDKLFFCSYDHKMCANCLLPHVRAALPNYATCLAKDCKATLGDSVIKGVLPQKEYDVHLNRDLDKLLEGNDQFFKCPNPNCGIIMERIRGQGEKEGKEQIMGMDGKPISEEALRHRQEYRFRCRECQTEFCVGCFKIPYHLGFTCQKYQEYLKSRHCRYCAGPMEGNEAPDSASQPPSLQDVCTNPECLAKRDIACSKTHACGHHCGGVKNEETCLPCLQEGCKPEDVGQGAEDFCNICWVEDLGSAPSIKLDCGHVFHYQCVVNKLRGKWPTPRITFGFCNCPLCKTRISHPSLKEELEPILKLIEEIQTKAVQRLEFEGLKNAPEITSPTGKYYQNPAAFAMDKFAYYPCYQCKKSYFGGQRRCDAGDREGNFDPKDLVCGACAGGALATDCPKHGKDFIEYKCQFCCSVANWFCWGKTHFCEECHTRQQKGDYLTKKPKSDFPVCPGPEQCPLKRKHPPAGEEFSLGCMLCQNDQPF